MQRRLVVHFPSCMPSSLSDWASGHLPMGPPNTDIIYSDLTPTVVSWQFLCYPLNSYSSLGPQRFVSTCPVTEDQLWTRQPTNLLHHPMGRNCTFFSEVQTLAVGNGSPSKFVLPWVSVSFLHVFIVTFYYSLVILHIIFLFKLQIWFNLFSDWTQAERSRVLSSQIKYLTAWLLFFFFNCWQEKCSIL